MVIMLVRWCVVWTHGENAPRAHGVDRGPGDQGRRAAPARDAGTLIDTDSRPATSPACADALDAYWQLSTALPLVSPDEGALSV